MLRKNANRKNISSILLLLLLAALLIAYSSLTGSLRRRIISPEQAETLDYANSRAINQAPITTNLIMSEAEVYDAEATENQDGQPAANNDSPNTQMRLPVSFSSWENMVRATLDARHVEENDVSVTAFDLDFESIYSFTYPENGPATNLEWIFPFPENLETLNGVHFLVDGKEVNRAQFTPEQIRWLIPLKPGDSHEVTIRYRADGVGSFSYGLNQGRRTEQLDVIIEVLGLDGSLIPSSTLRTTEALANESGGETFKWQYENLVVDRDIALTLPTQLSFAQRLAELQDDFSLLSTLAPLWVGLFVLSLAGLLYLRGKRMPLPAYLLLALNTALFYPLLTFLSGLIGVTSAAVAALLMVGGLTMLFMRIAIGEPEISRQTGWLLFVFLGVLSLGLLLPVRNLMLTGGGFILVGTFMFSYARRPEALLSELSADSEPVEPAESTPTAPFTWPAGNTEIAEDPIELESSPEVEAGAPEPEPEEIQSGETAIEEPFNTFCPHCGRGMADDFSFCPQCGNDGQDIQLCDGCGLAQPVQTAGEESHVHCVNCGHRLID